MAVSIFEKSEILLIFPCYIELILTQNRFKTGDKYFLKTGECSNILGYFGFIIFA